MEKLKDQLLTDIILPGVIVIFVIGVGVVLLYQHFQKNLFAHKLKQETLKNSYQIELLRTSIRVQEEERKRIAEDLHDELGALLSILRMNMVMLEQQSDQGQDHILSGLQKLRQLSESALASMRSISHRLMPPQLKNFGLVKTLEYVLGQLKTAGDLHVDLNAPQDLPPLSWNINLGLYRVIMELLNNTIKHADASQVRIDIYPDQHFVICNYTDNGRGLNQAIADSGLGHKNIAGRINALDGTVHMGTHPEGGFHAYIRVPAENGQK